VSPATLIYPSLPSLYQAMREIADKLQSLPPTIPLVYGFSNIKPPRLSIVPARQRLFGS